MEKPNSDKEKQPGIIVPIEQISTEALEGLISEFVLREGTDYGAQEVSYEAKNRQIMNQLRAGHILIVYDPNEESCSILRKESLPKKILNNF